MKKWGGQLDIHPLQSKNWGGGPVPTSPPGLTPLTDEHTLTLIILKPCINLDFVIKLQYDEEKWN